MNNLYEGMFGTIKFDGSDYYAYGWEGFVGKFDTYSDAYSALVKEIGWKKVAQ